MGSGGTRSPILLVKDMGCKMISFDTSLVSTGFAIFINGKCTSYGNIKIDKKLDENKKLHKMIFEIIKTIDREKPDICVWEIPTVTRNAQTQRNLTMIVGAIMGKCVKDMVYYYGFRPTEWRKEIKDCDEIIPKKRDELKKWSIKKASKLLGLDIESDDIADAISIGLAYINKYS